MKKVQLKDNTTNEKIYPITHIDYVIGGGGDNSKEIEDLLKQTDEINKKLEDLESDVSDITTDIVAVANRPIKVTYKNLRLMSELGLLNPGTKYQLTDYECVVANDRWRKKVASAGHRFDLIITANTPEILNHECSATHHDFSDEIKQCEDEYDTLNEMYDDICNYDNISFNEKIEYYTSKLNIIDEDINEINKQIDDIESKPDFDNNNDDKYDVEILYLKIDELDKQTKKLQDIIDFYESLQDCVSNDNIEEIDAIKEDFEKILESKKDELYKLEDESEYFEKCNLNLWKIWYVLDTYQSGIYCEWYDEEKGKGVIYRMIDEYNNDVGYDFKNILVPVIKLTKENIDEIYNDYYIPNFYKDILEKIDPWRGILICIGEFYEGYSRYCYTFSSYFEEDDRYPIEDSTVNEWSMCFNNTIKSHREEPTECELPYVVCFEEVIFNNYIGISCENIILNQMCAYNEIIYGCENIYIGDECVLNRIVNFSECIYLGEMCAKNVFENEEYNIILGEYCSGNIFRPNCEKIYLYGYSSNNLFDGDISYITLNEESNNNNKFVGSYEITSHTVLNDCIFERTRNITIEEELYKCYICDVNSMTLNSETFVDNRKCSSSTLHIEDNGNIIWSDETLDIIERLQSLEEENEELRNRLQTLEDNFEQMVTEIIDSYQFRTVCKYDIRGTGNINIVAASSLQD